MRSVVLWAAASMVLGAQGRWWSSMERGAAAERNGQFSAAVECYREALTVAGGEDPRQIVLAANALAGSFAETGDFVSAQRTYERALSATAPESADRGVVLGSMAALHMEMGHKAKGEKLLRESVAMLERTVPEDDDQLNRAANNLAELLIEHRKYDEAQSLLERVFENSPGERGLVWNNLGLLRLGQKKSAEAIVCFRQALDAFGREHPYSARVWNNLGTAYTRAGNVAEAESAYLEGIRVAETRLGERHPVYASLLRNHALLAKRNGRKDAPELIKRADQVTREQGLRSGTYSTVDVSAFVGLGK